MGQRKQVKSKLTNVYEKETKKDGNITFTSPMFNAYLPYPMPLMWQNLGYGQGQSYKR